MCNVKWHFHQILKVGDSALLWYFKMMLLLDLLSYVFEIWTYSKLLFRYDSEFYFELR